MFSVRLWHGSQLVMSWIAALAGLVLERWLVARGIHKTAFVDGRVEVVGGLWPEDLATLIMVLSIGIVRRRPGVADGDLVRRPP